MKGDPAEPRIRKAALELMARKGVAGTTTQDIAARARCSQAAIYRHWPGKDALGRSLFDAGHEQLLQSMEDGAARGADPGERVLGTLAGLLRFARGNPAEFAFLFHVFHSDYTEWLAPHRRPRDLVLREVQAALRAAGLPPGRAATKTALLLGMVIRLAFLERQSLVDGNALEVEDALLQAAAAVLES